MVLGQRQRHAGQSVVGAFVAQVAVGDVAAGGAEPGGTTGRPGVDQPDDVGRHRRLVGVGGEQYPLPGARRARDRHLDVVGVEPVPAGAAEEVVHGGREGGELGVDPLIGELAFPVRHQFLPAVHGRREVERVGRVARVAVGTGDAVAERLRHRVELAVQVVGVDDRRALPPAGPARHRRRAGGQAQR